MVVGAVALLSFSRLSREVWADVAGLARVRDQCRFKDGAAVGGFFSLFFPCGCWYYYCGEGVQVSRAQRVLLAVYTSEENSRLSRQR